MPTQDERRAATRRKILDALRLVVVEQGFEQASLTEVLDRAGLSKGAFYHHFASKEDAFAAVFVETSNAAIRAAAERAAAATSPYDALVRACVAWLNTVLDDPATTRILLVEAPAALGWERCRMLENASSLGAMRSAVHAAVNAGEIEVPGIDVAARMINALVGEAALGLHEKPTPARRRAAIATIEGMIGGLRPSA